MQLLQRRFLWVGSLFTVLASLFVGSVIFAPSANAAGTEYYQYIPGPPASVRVTGGNIVGPWGLTATDGTNTTFKGDILVKASVSRIGYGKDPSKTYADCRYTATLKVSGDTNDAAAANPVDDTAYVDLTPDGGGFGAKPAGFSATEDGACKFGDISFTSGAEAGYVEGQGAGGDVKLHVKASPTDTGGAAGDPANPNASGGEVKCTSGGSLDWILCPVIDGLLTFSTFLTGLISNLLQVPAITPTSNGGVLYNVWQNMRNIANGFFVLVMLVIIFSQASSMGLSAYGLKKTIPKLALAAIFVNLSFYICSFGVDVSNVLGNGVSTIMNSALNGAGGTGDPVGIISSILGGITASIIGAAIAFFCLGSLGVLALSLVVGFLVIAARQALVVILIIVSPIAFVLWILPNTEQYYRRWSELFMTVLFMYPLIMLILTGSQLAAKVIAGI